MNYKRKKLTNYTMHEINRTLSNQVHRHKFFF